jgi:phosphomannomutase / phosphoglucomutase
MIDPNIFREYDIRGVVGPQLDRETVNLIGRAAGTFFLRNNARRIAIGYDARASSPEFCGVLTDALNAVGCDVVLIGMVPTPVLYHTVFTQGVDGGVMITGSHNPPDHNGFKICLGKAALFGSQIREIRDIALSDVFETGDGSRETIEVLDEYEQDILSRISLGGRPLRVVVDSGNGMGGITAVPIYRKLGIDVVDIFTEPDPLFPNHHPDPTIVENLQDTIAAVRQSKADVGIAFDGDGDRLGVVDETGRIVWGDELLTLYARTVLACMPGATIIAEVKCSQVLFDDIAAHGGVPLMWKAGHSLIKAKIKETGAALAGEMSGHMFFADRFYGFDDAAYAGARLLEILSATDKPLSELLAGIPKLSSTPELHMPCPDDIKFDVVASVAEQFAKTNEVVTIDGARVLFEHGWGLVRPSNTQPMLVLRFEATDEDHLQTYRDTVETIVEQAIAERQ